ncbi:MAG: AraC family transcriptional regulator [Bacteroidota bacterium]
MKKRDLPVYSIATLKESAVAQKDFVADGFAHYLAEHTNLRFPHKHSFYHLVYFSKGSGSHSIDFVNFPVKAGQVYFMIPGQVHSWDFKSGPDGYIVNFSEDYLTSLLADPRYLDQFAFLSGNAPEQVINIPLDGRSAIEQLLKTIISEGNSSAPLKDDFARAALLQLLIAVSRFTTGNEKKLSANYSGVLLRNFQKLIELHYKEKRLTKDYAAMLYITPNHLNALTKDVSGRSAGELIRDRVLLEAKRMLINANMTITEIAQELDFMDNSYFSKFFRKYVGVSPEVFRKQTIKN